MGVSLKKSKYFITCNSKYYNNISYNKNFIYTNLINEESNNKLISGVQLSLFDEKY